MHVYLATFDCGQESWRHDVELSQRASEWVQDMARRRKTQGVAHSRLLQAEHATKDSRGEILYPMGPLSPVYVVPP